jgi:MYXO-CTERM domain-containing protein
VLDQSLMNYLMVAETYDEQTGVYKFNTPMAGFGSGAYVLALAQRAGMLVDPACGAYFDETNLSGAGGAGGAGGSGSGGSATGTGGHDEAPPKEGCACRASGTSTTLTWMIIPGALALAFARRRRR